MRHTDFAPFYRHVIGFDRLASLLDNTLAQAEKQPGYPPYNIEVTDEDHYQLTLAVAGFTRDDLDIQVEANTLTVRGQQGEAEQDGKRYLHRGIAARNFERRYQLADHVEVVDARLENGLLHIDLERRVPEAMKPKTISIGEGADSRRQLADKATDQAA